MKKHSIVVAGLLALASPALAAVIYPGGGGSGGSVSSTNLTGQALVQSTNIAAYQALIATNNFVEDVIYVNGSTGSDANSGSQSSPLLTIEQATTNSVAGRWTRIEVAPGTYYTTNGIFLKVGNWLWGYGVTVVNLATNASTLKQFGVVSRENTLVQGVYTTNYWKDSFYQLAFGYHHGLNWGWLTNAGWIDCKARGDSDAWFARVSNNASAYKINCDFEAKWDADVWVKENVANAVTINDYSRGGRKVISAGSTFNPSYTYTHAYGLSSQGGGAMIGNFVLEDVFVASTNNNYNQAIKFDGTATDVINGTLRNVTVVGDSDMLAGTTGLGDVQFNGCILTNVAGRFTNVLSDYVHSFLGDPYTTFGFNGCLWADSTSNLTRVVYGNTTGLKGGFGTNDAALFASKIIGTDASGKYVPATLSGLTWDGTTLTSSGGSSFWNTNATDGSITNINGGGVSVGTSKVAITNGGAAITLGVSPGMIRTLNNGVSTLIDSNTITTGSSTNSGYSQAANFQATTSISQQNAYTLAAAASTWRTAGAFRFTINPATGIKIASAIPLLFSSTDDSTGAGSFVGLWGTAAGLIVTNPAAANTFGSITASNGTFSGSITATNGYIAVNNGVSTLIDSNTITTGNSTNSGNIQTATLNTTGNINGPAAGLQIGNGSARVIIDTSDIRPVGGSGTVDLGRGNIRWDDGYFNRLWASETVTATNGLFLPQLSGIPSSVDLRSSSGNTNWLALNLGGDVALIKTNPAAASSYLTNWLTVQLNFVEGSTAGTSVSLTTATAANITSVALTPGTWDLTASIYFDFVGATVTFIEGAFNTTSATIPGPPPEDVAAASPNVTVVSSDESLTIPRRRVTITANTTYYLVGRAAFSAGSIDAYGKILATRVN